MKTMNLNQTKIQKYKYKFDKITSGNSQNWQLVLFWIICLELSASIFEYEFFKNSTSYVNLIEAGVFKELLISFFLVCFVAGCIYNIIFFTKKSILTLIIFGFLCSYLFITSDFTFSFLAHNIEPTHFFQTSVSLALIIELIFKFILAYFIFQLVISYQNRKKA